MKDLIKSEVFIIGFCFGVFWAVLANLYTLLPNREAICFDCYETWGFPFAVYETGTMLHLNNFIWAGVAANLFLTIIFSFFIGLIFKLVWSKVVSQKLR